MFQCVPIQNQSEFSFIQYPAPQSCPTQVIKVMITLPAQILAVQNAGFVKYLREKVEKLKLLKMLLFIICEAPQKISTIFKPFLAIFTLFHLKNWPYLQKPEFGNLAKTRF